MSDVPDLTVEPKALRVVKRAIPIHARFAAEDGECATLEGTVGFRKTDAILTGVNGEHWPVRNDLFLASYEPLAPTQAGEDGTYVKRPAISLALRLERPLLVPVNWQHDLLHGQPGNWLLQYADGSYGVLQDDIFCQTYAAAIGKKR